MTEVFTHPVTGQVLETKEDFSAALAEIEERMAPLYRERRAIRDFQTLKFPAPEMPPPRQRTEKQDRIARCPRCGTPLTGDLPPKREETP